MSPFYAARLKKHDNSYRLVVKWWFTVLPRERNDGCCDAWQRTEDQLTSFTRCSVLLLGPRNRRHFGSAPGLPQRFLKRWALVIDHSGSVFVYSSGGGRIQILYLIKSTVIYYIIILLLLMHSCKIRIYCWSWLRSNFFYYFVSTETNDYSHSGLIWWVFPPLINWLFDL